MKFWKSFGSLIFLDLFWNWVRLFNIAQKFKFEAFFLKEPKISKTENETFCRFQIDFLVEVDKIAK